MTTTQITAATKLLDLGNNETFRQRDCSFCGAEDVGRVYKDRCGLCGCHFAPWLDGFRAWTEASDPSSHFADTYQLMRAQAAVLLGELDRMAKIVAAGKTIGVIK